MKKVLVTGGAGFIGSYVVNELLRRGYKVRVLDDLSKSIVSYRQQKNLQFIKIDLTDKRKSFKYFKGFDKCIHLAAKIGGIGYFHKYPAFILNENNKLYATVFESAAELKYKLLVYVSSSMVFESTKHFPSKESDLNKIPLPITAYGFSKLIGEIYCRSFWEEFKLPYIIVRPFNAYGINEAPGDKIGYSHVIPDLIKKILDGQYPVEILGNGRQTRCFTHASDIARGIVMAMENPKAVNNDFNLGTDKETRILDLAKMIFKLIRKGKPFKYKLVPGFKHDVQRRVPDISKARRILGWNPQVELSAALPEIIEWIKENYSSKHL